MSASGIAGAIRLFIAVDPHPDNVLALGQKIQALQKMAPRARWVRTEKLHLTLVFLGQMDQDKLVAIQNAMSSAAEMQAPFSLHFGDGGTFGEKKHARVLWTGIKGDVSALCTLQMNLAQQLEPLGYVPEHRTYAPHLTLARAGDPRGDEKLVVCAAELAGCSFGATTVREMVLYRSDQTENGFHYSVLFRAPFRL